MLLSMVKPARAAVVSVFFALVMAALAGCSFKPEQQVWEISGPIFGTRYHISVVMEDNQARLQQLASGIDQALEGVDAAMSTWREDSELSRFNARPDQSGWTDLSAPLHTVLREAEAVSVLTRIENPVCVRVIPPGFDIVAVREKPPACVPHVVCTVFQAVDTGR